MAYVALGRVELAGVIYEEGDKITKKALQEAGQTEKQVAALVRAKAIKEEK